MRFLRIATLVGLAGLWTNCSNDSLNGGPARQSIDGGATFPNLTLDGIRSVATVDTPAVVSMSEYQDPTGAGYDLLHVIGIFMWCPHCNNETNNLSTIATWQADHRVAVVQIAMEGYGSASPTWTDLQKWVRDHNLSFPVLMDGQGAQLGQYFRSRLDLVKEQEGLARCDGPPQSRLQQSKDCLRIVGGETGGKVWFAL